MKMTIGRKLGTGFGCMIALVVIIGSYVFVSGRKILDEATLVRDESSVFAVRSLEMKYYATQVQQWLTDISATRAAEGYADGFDEAEANATLFIDRLNQFRDMYREENDQERLAECDKLEMDFKAFHQMGIKMANAYIRGGPEAGNLMMDQFDGFAEAIGERMGKFTGEQLAELNEASNKVVDVTRSVRSTSVIILVCSLMAGIVCAFLIAVSIQKPVAGIVEVINSVAEGDLTRRVTVSSTDEIGDMSKIFNDFVERLHSSIASVAQSAVQVASASQQLSASSEEMASGAEEQTSQTSQVATSVEEMSATVQQVAKNANSAASSALEAGKTANKGGDIVGQTVNGISRISRSVQDLQNVIQGLSRNSEKIGNIIGVIDDVADQTNLLALNAAIEAARAGEQGRGFAVVADEVRKLAERTTVSTREIAEMVKSIQGDTSQAVTSMETGRKEVEAGVNLAQQAGAALNEIVQGVQGVQDMVQQIATASEEQSAAAEEISSNVESIASVARQSASGTQQTASASQELSGLADGLQNLVNQFRLN